VNEYDLYLARLFLPVEESVDRWAWITPSFTRPGVEHEVAIDRHDGTIYCSCEDSAYRQKYGHIFDRPETTNGCKHIRIIVLMVGGHL